MKIEKLEIEGFRSLKNVTWEPGNLNILIGPNGSGKSNLLSALEMLGAAARGELRSFVQRYGGFRTLAWDEKAPAVKMEIEGTHLWPVQGTSKQHHFLYSLSIPNYGRMGYEIAEEALWTRSRDVLAWNEATMLRVIEREVENARIAVEANQAPREIQRRQFNGAETILSLASTPFSPMGDGIYLFQSCLSPITVYSGLEFGRGSAARMPNPARAEETLEPSGSNLISYLFTARDKYPEFQDDLHRAMEAAFLGEFDGLTFGPAGDRYVQLRCRWKSRENADDMTQLSDGTLRFLFLIGILAHPFPPPLIAIDEPELGLHPSMMAIVAEYAAAAAEKTQVVLSTHSAEFLSAMPKDVVPDVFVFKSEQGETKIDKLDGERLRYWLREYTLGNLFRTGELEGMA